MEPQPMQEFAEMFRSGGIWMYLVLIAALPAWLAALGTFVLAIPAGVSGKLRMPLLICSALTLLGALLIVGLGYAGYQVGISEMQMALEHVSPEKRDALQARGREIANYPLTFAMYAAPIPGFLGFLGLATFFVSKGKADA